MGTSSSGARRGVVFDFNGTLLWDTPINTGAWDHFIERHGIRISQDKKMSLIHGKTNEAILKGFFGSGLSAREVEDLSEEKERFYRESCVSAALELAPGSIALFEHCRRKGIEIAIATSAGRSNMDFYIERYRLLDWFERERIVFNDGTMRSKPDPEVFLVAVARLGIPKEDIVIFEDSRIGVTAALASGAGKVVIVNSNKDDLSFEGCERIDSFVGMDYGLVS